MLPEPVHEVADPGPGRADHLCQTILTDSGDYGFSLAFLAEMRKQQEDPSQTLFGCSPLSRYRTRLMGC
jgi:hypothetical protein